MYDLIYIKNVDIYYLNAHDSDDTILHVLDYSSSGTCMIIDWKAK